MRRLGHKSLLRSGLLPAGNAVPQACSRLAVGGEEGLRWPGEAYASITAAFASWPRSGRRYPPRLDASQAGREVALREEREWSACEQPSNQACGLLIVAPEWRHFPSGGLPMRGSAVLLACSVSVAVVGAACGANPSVLICSPRGP